MIDEYPTFLDMVMKLGREDAENDVLEHVYHGEETQTHDGGKNA